MNSKRKFLMILLVVALVILMAAAFVFGIWMPEAAPSIMTHKFGII